jgi:hypothetical protein
MLRSLALPTFKARGAATTSLFGALVVVSIPLLWMRTAVIEALIGAALGWLTVSLIRLLGLAFSEDGQQFESPAPSTLILNGATFATSLFAVAALGVYRDFVMADVARGTYSAVAVALAASLALTFLIGALLSEMTKPSLATVLTTALSFVVPIGVGYLLATRFLDDLALLYVIAIGLLLGAISWMVVRDGASSQLETAANRVPWAAILIALCAFMLAYQIMQGFGVGLMLLAATPFALLAMPSSSKAAEGTLAEWETAHSLSLIGSFLGVLLISRLFATHFRADLRGISLDDQFALFGFLLGAITPALLASLWFESPQQNHSRSLWRVIPSSASMPRLFCIGLLSLILLSVLLAVWGIKVVPTFLFGLALSTVSFTPGAPRNHRNTGHHSTGQHTSAIALFSLALAVTLTQWTHRFLPLAELTRAQRLHLLLWAMGGAVFIVLAVDYGTRLASKIRNRNTPARAAL